MATKIRTDLELATEYANKITDKTELVETVSLTKDEKDSESTVSVNANSRQSYKKATKQVDKLVSQLNQDVKIFLDNAKWLDEMDKLLAERH